MFKNFSTLYLDVLQRVPRTDSDLSRINAIIASLKIILSDVDEAMGLSTESIAVDIKPESIFELKRIGEQVKFLSRKQYDTCEAHPEIPWNALILLNEFKDSNLSPSFIGALKTLLASLIESSRQLKKRLIWQQEIKNFLEKISDTEYSLFHLQLSLQEIFQQLLLARLETNIDTLIASTESILMQDEPSTLKVAYDKYEEMSRKIETVSLCAAETEENYAIISEFDNLKRDLSYTGLMSFKSKVMISCEAYKDAVDLYKRDQSKSYVVISTLHKLLKSIERQISENILSIRKKVKDRGLTERLDGVYWLLSPEERAQRTAKKASGTKRGLRRPVPSQRIEIAETASPEENFYPGLLPLIEGYISKNLLVIEEFIAKGISFGGNNFFSQLAKLYCLVVICESISALISYLPSLTEAEKTILRHFSDCRSVIIHSVDDPKKLQNLWGLFFVNNPQNSVLINAQLNEIFEETYRATAFVRTKLETTESALTEEQLRLDVCETARFTEILSQSINNPEGRICAPLTAMSSMLAVFFSNFSSCETPEIQHRYTSMLLCGLFGQMSKRIIEQEQGYAYAKTFARHPEWNFVVLSLERFVFRRGIFCHNIAESYQDGKMLFEEDALDMLKALRIQGGRDTHNILVTIDEKATSRFNAFNPDKGGYVYKTDCLIMNLLLRFEDLYKAGRVLLNADSQKSTTESKKIIRKVFEEYKASLSSEDQRKLLTSLDRSFDLGTEIDASESKPTEHYAVELSPGTVTESFSPSAGMFTRPSAELSTNIHHWLFRNCQKLRRDIEDLHDPVSDRKDLKEADDQTRDVERLVSQVSIGTPVRSVKPDAEAKREFCPRERASLMCTPEQSKQSLDDPWSTGNRCSYKRQRIDFSVGSISLNDYEKKTTDVTENQIGSIFRGDGAFFFPQQARIQPAGAAQERRDSGLSL